MVIGMKGGPKGTPLDTGYNPNVHSSGGHRRRTDPFGGFSFESESLPDFSEFEGTSGSEKSQQGDKMKPTEGRMPPTTTIETVTISRPLKVIAFLCGFFAGILLLMGLASSEWIMAKDTDPAGYKQGLFVYCIRNESLSQNQKPERTPFVPDDDPEGSEIGCHWLYLSIQGYTFVCGIFMVLAFFITCFGTALTVFGLRCRDPNKKYKYYRIAVIVMAIALVGALIAVVVYPIGFTNILSLTEQLEWEFGWAYGVAWGATIFLFGGIVLLLCDKETEEIYYKERTIVHYADPDDKN